MVILSLFNEVNYINCIVTSAATIGLFHVFYDLYTKIYIFFEKIEPPLLVLAY